MDKQKNRYKLYDNGITSSYWYDTKDGNRILTHREEEELGLKQSIDYSSFNFLPIRKEERADG